MAKEAKDSYESLVYDAAKYDRMSYYRNIPLPLHPLLQLIPIIGNVIVFVQTCKFIKRVNALVHVPYRERVETWVSTFIMLIIGMVPILGFVLTIYCTNCSDYLVIAAHYIYNSRGESRTASMVKILDNKKSYKKSGADKHVDLEKGIYENTPAAVSDGSLIIVSHTAEPVVSNKQKSEDKKVERSGTVFSQKSVVSIKEPESAQHTPSVFGRVSKLSWMDEIMALSPTDNNRTSLSNLAGKQHSPQTTYTDIHDLATRNSRMPTALLPSSSSLQNLPSYLTDALDSNMKTQLNSRRMTRSLHIDNSVLDKRESHGKKFKLLKRPDYSRLETGSIKLDRRSSSIIGLAPSPQSAATG